MYMYTRGKGKWEGEETTWSQLVRLQKTRTGWHVYSVTIALISPGSGRHTKRAKLNLGTLKHIHW